MITENPIFATETGKAGTTGPHISLIVGSIGYRRLLKTLIRVALPSADIEEIDPFSQTIRGSGVSFALNSEVIILGGIGTEVEALSALQRLRERDDCPPIILLTSHDLAPLAPRLCAAGAAAVLLKDALSQNAMANCILQVTGRSAAQSRHTNAPQNFGHVAFEADGERVVLAIDGFQSLHPLSANPMAQVMLAERIDDHARAVVKIPLSAPIHDAAAIQQFCEQYECFSRLGGRSVVRYLDAGIAGTWPYVVLEYLAAGDLCGRMAGGLTTVAAVHILEQIAMALVDVHAGGFAHMDLKPENIFFREDGSLVLIDFNISTRIGDITRSRINGDVIGSPFYMSPEQGRGLPVDGRSDLYSAGIIFYEMLMGDRPFTGENSAQVVFKHLHEEVPLLPKRIRHLQVIVDKLLAKSPDERYANASALVDALQPLIGRGDDAGDGTPVASA